MRMPGSALAPLPQPQSSSCGKGRLRRPPGSTPICSPKEYTFHLGSVPAGLAPRREGWGGALAQGEGEPRRPLSPLQADLPVTSVAWATLRLSLLAPG